MWSCKNASSLVYFTLCWTFTNSSVENKQKVLLKLETLLNIICVLWYLACWVLLASIMVTNMMAHTPFKVCMLVCLHKCVYRSSNTMATATSITSHSCLIDFICQPNCSDRCNKWLQQNICNSVITVTKITTFSLLYILISKKKVFRYSSCSSWSICAGHYY